jgi:hypothetical protein
VRIMRRSVTWSELLTDAALGAGTRFVTWPVSAERRRLRKRNGLIVAAQARVLREKGAPRTPLQGRLSQHHALAILFIERGV